MNPSLEPGRTQDNPLRVSPSRPDYGAPERGQGSPHLYDPVPPSPGMPQWWMERRAHPQPDPRDYELRDLGVELEWRVRVKRRTGNATT